MTTYYNEYEAYPAQWLRNLIDAGHLPSGDVDESDIADVDPADLRSYDQCHFFAGIGGWPYALRLAGWPDDVPVWTGSCPCQPFSQAGKQKGSEDARHLWPVWSVLIEKCAPAIIFGEQVASKLARNEWLPRVSADLERMGYTVAAADLPAVCVGAPHVRHRLWWMAVADYWSERGKRCRLSEVRRERSFSWCEDVRRVEAYFDFPAIPKPLVRSLRNGIPCGVDRLCAYGNAIVPQVAAAFIRSAVEAIRDVN